MARRLSDADGLHKRYQLPRSVAIGAIIVAVIGDWILTDYFTHAPMDVPMYLVTAVPLSWICFLVARAAWRWNHPRVSPSLRRVMVAAATHLGLLVVSIASALAIPVAHGIVIGYAYHRDPIGVGSDVGTPPCYTSDLRRAVSGNGVVANVRRTWCSGDWDDDLTYFVFVHRASAPNAHDNLVFRYRGYSTIDTPPPSVSWAAPNKLQIGARGFILEITKQQFRADHVSITYYVRIDEKLRRMLDEDPEH